MENQVLLFFNIGGSEMIIILLVIIMFFGSKKIPELARGLGKGMRELKNATNDIQREIKGNANPISDIKDAVDVKKQMRDIMKDEPVEHPATDNKSDNKVEENKEEKKTVENTVKRGDPYTPSQESKEENT